MCQINKHIKVRKYKIIGNVKYKKNFDYFLLIEIRGYAFFSAIFYHRRSLNAMGTTYTRINCLENFTYLAYVSARNHLGHASR